MSLRNVSQMQSRLSNTCLWRVNKRKSKLGWTEIWISPLGLLLKAEQRYHVQQTFTGGCRAAQPCWGASSSSHKSSTSPYFCKTPSSDCFVCALCTHAVMDACWLWIERLSIYVWFPWCQWFRPTAGLRKMYHLYQFQCLSLGGRSM